MKRVPRMTVQRRIILEELKAMHNHPTADEIYHRVRERLPRISLGTVYRNLDRLAASGMIRRLDNAGPPMRFDADLDGHTHIRCVKCGRITDLVGSSGASEYECDREVLAGTGYTMIERRIEYTGICPACAGKEGEPS
jgi:Fur family ferric uptake transcriptional regulator